ncbi:MAG: hypothetical protein HC802_16035 [Caldilineaceae bacterium]|nr:hypothetical protein [Caldilineaceae bacterium]
MRLPELKPHQNGRHEAPPHSSGAFRVQTETGQTAQPGPVSRPTDFPADYAPRSQAAIVYGLNRFRLGNSSLIRWIYTLLLLVAIFWAPGWLPGGLWVSGAALIAFGLLLVRSRRLRRRRCVRFAPAEAPEIESKKLPLERQDCPIHNRTFLRWMEKSRILPICPGFYRRFPTGERALICLVRQRTFWRIAHWPDEEVGMWYIFFTPDAVDQVQWGRLDFGDAAWPSVAVTYEENVPAQGRFRSAQLRREIAYLACPNEADAQKIWADLMSDLAGKRVGISVEQR